MTARWLMRVLLVGSLAGVVAAPPRLHGQVPTPAAPVVREFVEYRYSDLFGNQSAEIAKLEQRAQMLAAQLRGKSDPAKEAELKKIVEESFDKRHAIQVADAKTLAEKLDKLKDVMKKREDKKSEIVARRVKQLLGEADDLEWNVALPRGETGLSRVESLPVPSMPAPPTTAFPKAIYPNPVAIPLPDLKGSPASTDGARSRVGEIGSDDVEILQLELDRAKLNHEEAVDALSRSDKLEASGRITSEEAAKRKFAVDARRLDILVAERRLQIARARQSKKDQPTLDKKLGI